MSYQEKYWPEVLELEKSKDRHREREKRYVKEHVTRMEKEWGIAKKEKEKLYAKVADGKKEYNAGILCLLFY